MPALKLTIVFRKFLPFSVISEETLNLTYPAFFNTSKSVPNLYGCPIEIRMRISICGSVSLSILLRGYFFFHLKNHYLIEVI